MSLPQRCIAHSVWTECQKNAYASDTSRDLLPLRAAMTSLSTKILDAAVRRPEGSLLAAKEFLALGKRDAIDQALRRLCSRGQLVKITRGRYALPVRSRFGTRPPSPELVIARLNEEQGEQLVSSGRQAPRWQFLLADRPAGQAIRALAWLGPDQASAAMPKLRQVLSQSEWNALMAVRAELPLWLAELLNEQKQLEPCG